MKRECLICIALYSASFDRLRPLQGPRAVTTNSFRARSLREQCRSILHVRRKLHLGGPNRVRSQDRGDLHLRHTADEGDVGFAIWGVPDGMTPQHIRDQGI
jgi:hypothetical protein